jgi:hypothetical protein
MIQCAGLGSSQVNSLINCIDMDLLHALSQYGSIPVLSQTGTLHR